jgi:PII-like signaling protein
MDEPQEAERLVVYATEDDEVDGEALWSWVVRQAKETGVAGATVWRGVAGLGRGGRTRSDRFPDAEAGLPIAVEVIDRPAAIQGLLDRLWTVSPEVLVTVEPVTRLA